MKFFLPGAIVCWIVECGCDRELCNNYYYELEWSGVWHCQVA